ncbi:acyltransferase [Aestuariibacter salexigens]|uniref:acyltransferase n=1 Tax=Aestuariibacter salexigens TaxID=226010 RepID=UPI0004276BB4|nr:acyltransferase [Aestuariibacter salexigens]
MRHLFSNIIGVLSILGYGINTLFWVIPLLIFSFFKLIIPIQGFRKAISHLIDGCATCWISVNNFNQRVTSRTRWDVQGTQDLRPNDWYLVISNHQSWVDIVVLQRIFNHRLPFLKFFLKKELIWVPFLGLAWWALDFPFMRRYSNSFLAKNPHLKGKDLETTRKACQKFRFKPVSVMNFVEGTRFTQSKHDAQSSPYKHLLKPKAGGVAFVLSAMGEQLHKLVDVTIHYPQGAPSFWDFVCGKVRNVQVRVNVLPIEELFSSGTFSMEYFDHPEQRIKFQAWLNQRWLIKDQLIEQLITR